jgi:uracil-DNA glycosylase family 4
LPVHSRRRVAAAPQRIPLAPGKSAARSPYPAGCPPKLASVDAAERREHLIDLLKEMKEGHECPLAATRTNLVFGAGNADADLMFVGEAPGRVEDEQGLPFVGRAGQLLDQLLGEVGMARGDVFICNVLKCRPPGNRDPSPDEIEACKPYLYRQIELIEPKVVCTLGNFATKLLTRSSRGIMSVRGKPQVHELGGRWVRVYPLCHPAAALRTPATLQALREDFQGLPALLEEPAPLPPGAAPPPGPPEAAAAPQLDLFG